MKLKVFHENEWREYPAKTYAEYTYEWLGEPHESASIKLDSSGHEVARNLNHFADTEPRQSTRAEGSWYWQQFTNAKVEVGKTYTFSIIVDKISDDDVPVRVDIGTSATPNNYTRDVISTASNVVFGEREVTTFTITEREVEGGREYLSFRIRNQQEATTVAYREAMLEESDTFGGYLDGDASPSRAWVDFQPRNISGIKRIWHQPTPPPAGTHYAWLGEPHGSVSVRLDGDGNELARNLVENPRGRNDAAGWRVQSGGTISYDADRDMIAFTPDRAGSGAYITISEGNNDLLTIFENGGIEPAEVTHRLGAGDRFAHVTIQPGETVTLRNDDAAGNINFIAVEVREFHEGGVLYFRAMATAPGESDGSYFDGDTASDRANDLWYDADGVPHEWVNGQGWVAH